MKVVEAIVKEEVVIVADKNKTRAVVPFFITNSQYILSSNNLLR